MNPVVVSFLLELLHALAVTVEPSDTAVLVMKQPEGILTESHASQSVNRTSAIARVRACLLCVNQQIIHDSSHITSLKTQREGEELPPYQIQR
jgi:hypothetical protein